MNDKKIPIISPLYHNGNFIIDFYQKAELFNSFFSEPCSILQNSSKLSTNLVPRTDQSLTSIKFSQDNILKIIQNLNPSKAHGRGKINISMIKICANSLCKLLEIIFESCIIKGKKSISSCTQTKRRAIVKESQTGLIFQLKHSANMVDGRVIS